MTLDQLYEFFGWCTLINYVVLLYWFAMFVWAHDRVYRLHCRWFRLSEESFDAMHYGGMGLFKLGIFFFNLVPYLVLRFAL